MSSERRWDLSRWPWRRLSGLAFAAAALLVVGSIVMQGKPRGDGAPTGAMPAGGSLAMGNTMAQAQLPPGHPPAASAAAGAHELDPAQIQAMADRLAERLTRQPDDADGWAMLARSHALTGQHAKAVPAFRKAAALRPNDPVLLADFADALAMTQQRQLAGEPLELVRRALKADRGNFKALSLAGTEAFDRQDYAAALAFWDDLKARAGADHVFVQQIQSGIDEARARAAGTVGSAASGAGNGPVKVKISRSFGL